MNIAASTDDGYPIRCGVCSHVSVVNVSSPPGDSVCPVCGTHLWVPALIEVTQRQSFVPDLQIASLPATDRQHALHLLAVAAAENLSWSERQRSQYEQELLRREELGSTGIGRGFALPHARADGLDHCFTIMAYIPDGIDFLAADGQPVHTLIGLAFPKSRPGDGLRLLELMSRSLRAIGRCD